MEASTVCIRCKRIIPVDEDELCGSCMEVAGVPGFSEAEERHIRALRSRLMYLKAHTKRLTEQGIIHAYGTEVEALTWVLSLLDARRLSENAT